MHNNYHFLCHLSSRLQEILPGMKLATCFSQQKDELVIGFANDNTSIYIKAALSSDFSCLSFPEDFARARKNSVDLFGEVIGATVKEIYQYTNERAFDIRFTNGSSFLFKMHGNRSNIILYEGQEIVKIFKHNLKNDHEIIPAELNREIDQGKENFMEMNGNFKTLFPTFGTLPALYLEEKGYGAMSPEEQWATITDLLKQMESGTYYIVKVDGKIHFSMINMGEIISVYDDPLDAITRFYYYYVKTHQLEKEKNTAIKQMKKAIGKAESYLVKTSQKLEKIQKGRSYEEIANLIMANLHTIPKNQSSVSLSDFYRDNETIEIKLNGKLTPQKNAENYYRKAKNQKIEIRNLEQNIKQKEKEYLGLKEKLDRINAAENVKELRQVMPETKSGKTQQVTLPFKTFQFEGFDIWVGKSAQANDQMTLKFATKEDLWLHAKDVSGSHVVIKNKPGQAYPMHVIEKAAALAAFYSKRKNDSLCPVIYTPKKYVRKQKSAPPGKVVVEKEQVILIEPQNFDTRTS